MFRCHSNYTTSTLKTKLKTKVKINLFPSNVIKEIEIH